MKVIFKSAILFVSVSFSLFAQTSPEEQLKAIDQEIGQISKQIHDERLKIMHAEVESETYMKNEWGGYTKEIQNAEYYEDRVHKLEQRLQQLMEQKESLQKAQK